MNYTQNTELFADTSNNNLISGDDDSAVTSDIVNNTITHASSDAIPIRKKKNEYERSINSFSSILSDQTSPNIYWAPSSFSSITSFDQLFGNSKRASTSSLSFFGMTGATISDPAVQEMLLKEKVKKASVDMELFMRQLYNDSSLGMYHMSEHIRRRVPLMVEEKKGLMTLSGELDIAMSDVKDSHEIAKTIPEIDAFRNISKMLEGTIEIMEEVKGKDKKWKFWDE
ncbi:17537_t:CDS:2 [Acaulospora colombiana]|uniref:17537_t:CDS:1 n=1 Tax=Acaulospora colombiana TaxID=27376 RepID=A0ACA9KZK7_9GLOM|nr:17537_t:CDS:2 [Acaulospora colombiana]